MTLSKMIVLCAALLLVGACGKSESKKTPTADPAPEQAANTATPPEPAEKPPEPAAGDPQAGQESPEEAIPTPEDFEEEATAEISAKNLEDAVKNLEKQLEDEE